MKALFLPQASLAIGSIVDIKDEDFHHLVVVCRIDSSESLLLLNGSGISYLAKVVEISKRSLRLEVLEAKPSSIQKKFSAMLLVPKKDALDLMIKSCVELAVHEIILVRGDHSVERIPEPVKLEKMVKQAIEQSNSPHTHSVRQVSLKEFDFQAYESVNILDVFCPLGKSPKPSGKMQLLVVGPEGGYSESERGFFQALPNANFISLPTNILRAPTALGAGLGWLYAQNSVS